MIILNDMPGQLCNRIWSFVHFAAFGMANNVSVVVPFFGDYADLFPDLNREKAIYFVDRTSTRYVRTANRLFRLTRRVSEFIGTPAQRRIHLSREAWGVENWPEETLRAQGNVVFLSGWNHWKPLPDLRPWHSRLCEMLRPSAGVIRKVNDVIEPLRRAGHPVVGMHIRRGDYKVFADGRYFFEIAAYVSIMRQIAGQLGGKVSFLVCSNEPYDPSAFAGLDTVSISDASSIDDLHALSQCDYIIGPNSTFSMWASFFGQVPIHFVSDPSAMIRLETFEPFIGFNLYRSGREFVHEPDLVERFSKFNFAM